MYLKNWILSLFFIFNSVSSFALQHALVVGINEYPDYENLEGAVNDAKIIVEALRRIQVNIPNERVLLNAQATRGNVEQAWNNMVKQANAGDTLIFTYAGHGSHVKDIIPFDEQNVGNNGEDETLVLYDKMIRDDELTELFSKANKFKIVFLADSCHSYGFLTRSGNCRSSRSIPQQLIKANQRFFTTKNTYFYTKGDEKEKLPHVTFITAVDNDTLEVCEMTFKGKAHGALSWFFAQALAGKADRNNDKLLDFQELNDYISHSVAEVSQYSQNPKLDRGSIHTIISLQANSQPQTPILNHNIIIKIKVENGTAPNNLRNIQIVQKNFDLRFVKKSKNTEVYNYLSDKIAILSNQSLRVSWQKVIDKEILVKTLFKQVNSKIRPVEITTLWRNQEGNGLLYKQGEVIQFSIKPLDTNLKTLTLFNITGNGDLQFLYPFKRHNLITNFPFYSPSIRISPPSGRDDLIAILCTQIPKRLNLLLKGNAPFLPKPMQLISVLKTQECQVGRMVLFSAAN